MSKIIDFPKDKIVRIDAEKPKGIHQKKIEQLLWELSYEFAKAYHAKELDLKTEFRYSQILPVEREDKKFTKLLCGVYPTEIPF